VIFTRNKGLKSKTKYRSIWADIIGVLVTVIVFILPFYFLVVNAAKSQEESFRLNMSPPEKWLLFQNIAKVVSDYDWHVLNATKKLIDPDYIFCLLLNHHQWNDWLCHAP